MTTSNSSAYEASREQENALENLVLTHGRLMVKAGYADRSIRVTAPSHAEFVLSEGGNVTPQRTGNFTPEAFAFAAEAI